LASVARGKPGELGKEMERWRDGEMERWRDGEMERWRDGEMRRDGASSASLSTWNKIAPQACR
jgi:hypothetical protein